ncbi:hypothetical protein SRHO_G00043010 [Serrasalmus rhombeus]
MQWPCTTSMSVLWITGCIISRVRRICPCRGDQHYAVHWTMCHLSVSVARCLQRAASSALSAAQDLSWVDNAKVLHYVGAGVAFPTSMLFVCLQSALTYRLAKTQGEYNLGHFRLIMTLLAFVALVLSGVFFVQESFVLQHASAIFEWVFCVIIMLFHGTFAFEFAGISSNTMMILARGGTLGSSRADHKMESLSGASQHQSESMSML